MNQKERDLQRQQASAKEELNISMLRLVHDRERAIDQVNKDLINPQKRPNNEEDYSNVPLGTTFHTATQFSFFNTRTNPGTHLQINHRTQDSFGKRTCAICFENFPEAGILPCVKRSHVFCEVYSYTDVTALDRKRRNGMVILSRT
ncbi:hypothetical protein BpHYR1_046354 [Brachionus plicatilis]|uniref:Uncharacterized protein n=1 Tax=Brachionus plicatilis TaxID=10195 RepID=A0A3M7PEF7_BRAPC|nr:hypothetical protein BpHYR1_046354 [Brachionus plicatilis]